MKKMYILFYLLSFSSFTQGETISNCDEFKDSTLIGLYETYLNIEENQSKVWNNFSLSKNLILLTNKKYPKCLISFVKGQPSKSFTMSKDVGVSSWSAVDISHPTYPPYENDVVNIVKAFNKEKALIMNVDKNLFYHLDLASHEAFHHFYQTDQQMPKWFNYTNREDLSKKCYHDLPTYKQEADILILSYDFLLQGNVEAAKTFLRAYVKARKLRYLKLSNVVVTSNNGDISCQEAEANMELLEGHSQFVGERVAIELGLSNRYAIASDYKYSLYNLSKGWIEPFYQFGSLQLHVIRLLNKANFIPYTKNLYLSPTYKDSSLYKKIENYL